MDYIWLSNEREKEKVKIMLNGHKAFRKETSD